jgi:hypothetical protein
MILIINKQYNFGSVAQIVECRDDNSEAGGANPPVSINTEFN